MEARVIVAAMLAMSMAGYPAANVQAAPVAGPGGFVLQGKLYNAGGTSYVGTATVKVKILTEAGTCVLYQETHAGLDLSGSDGIFSVRVGAGSDKTNFVDSSALLKENVFSNATANVNVTGCGATAFAAGDARKLRLIVNDGSTDITMSPDQDIVASPYATVAESLQGVGPDGLIQVTSNITQNTIEQLAANSTALLGLLAGTSTFFALKSELPITSGSLDMSGSGKDIVVRDVPTGVTSAVNKTYVASTLGGQTLDLTGLADGQSVRWSAGGSKWSVYTPGTGTVTSIIAGTGLTGGTVTSAGTFALDVSGVTAATYGSATKVPVFAVDTYGRITTVTDTTITGIAPSGAAAGDLSGTYPNPAVAKLQGKAVSSNNPTDGQVLKFVTASSEWQPGTDAGVASVGLSMPAIFSVASSPLTSSGTLAVTLQNQSANQIFSGPASGGAATPTFRSLASDDIPTLDATTKTTGALDLATRTSGTLAVGRGGTGATSFTANAVIVGNGTSAVASIATGSSGQLLTSQGAGGTPAWTTATYPATTTANSLMYSSATNVVGEIASGATPGVLLSTAVSGLPAWNTGTNQTVLRGTGSGVAFAKLDLTTDVTGVLPVANGGLGFAASNANLIFAGPASGGAAAPTFRSLTSDDMPTLDATTKTSGALDLATRTSGTLAVGRGGTGATSFTANAVIVGNGTSAVASIATGSSGQLLTSQGAGGTPAWTTATYPATTTANALMYSSATNVIGEIASGATPGVLVSTAVSGLPAWNTGTNQTVLRGTGSGVAFAKLDLTTDVTGVLPIANGGVGSATSNANLIFAGPASGGAAAPTFRSLTSDDMPTLDATTKTSGSLDLATRTSGTLAVGRGGTGATSFTANAVIVGNGTSAVASIATGSSGQLLTSQGAGGAPAWTTATYPATTTANALMYSSATNVVGEIASGATPGVLLSTAVSGLPAWNTGTNQTVLRGTASGVAFAKLDLTSDVTGVLPVANGGLGSATSNANLIFAGPASGGAATPAFRSLVSDDMPTLDATTKTSGALDLATRTSGTLAVGRGGTGATSFTANAVIVGNGTSAVASIATGSSGQLLTSQGAGGTPAWTTATYPATTTANSLMYSSATNVVGEIASGATPGVLLSTAVSGLPAWNTGTNQTVLRGTASGVAFAKLDLTTDVTGVLPVANGGVGSATSNANLIFAGPASGGAAAPAFRSLTSDDIPSSALGTSGTADSSTFLRGDRTWASVLVFTQKEVGLIAQEVEKYFPEVVGTDVKGAKTLDYVKFTSLLLRAMKQQENEKQKLEQRLMALESRMASVESKTAESTSLSGVEKAGAKK